MPKTSKATLAQQQNLQKQISVQIPGFDQDSAFITLTPSNNSVPVLTLSTFLPSSPDPLSEKEEKDKDSLSRCLREHQVWMLDEDGELCELASFGLQPPRPTDSDHKWDHDSLVDKDEEQEQGMEAEFFHFCNFLQKAQQEGLAQEKANQARAPKRPIHYNGGLKRTNQWQAAQRRKLMNNGKTHFVTDYFCAKNKPTKKEGMQELVEGCGSEAQEGERIYDGHKAVSENDNAREIIEVSQT
jgi:hypothetical protein